jgi:hypothetical protein
VAGFTTQLDTISRGKSIIDGGVPVPVGGTSFLSGLADLTAGTIRGLDKISDDKWQDKQRDWATEQHQWVVDEHQHTLGVRDAVNTAEGDLNNALMQCVPRDWIVISAGENQGRVPTGSLNLHLEDVQTDLYQSVS